MQSGFDSVIRLFCWSLIVWIFGAMVTSCTVADLEPIRDKKDASSSSDVNDASGISFDEGGTSPILQMPFAAGYVSQCTQGVDGSNSHQSPSTKYDMDFDTSNTLKEKVYAPISGVVRVHMEDASKYFGYHACIDLGNDTYAILAHLSQIMVKDGEMVVAGQLVGYEGCTGYCSGDHVHIGLHKGDARKMGQFGTSIPVRYLLSDNTVKSTLSAIEASSIVCGIKAYGDKQEGHRYKSALTVVATPAPIEPTPAAPSPPPCSNSAGETKQPSVPQNNVSKDEPVWLNDLDLNGAEDTLMMRDNQWNLPSLNGTDVYVYGKGGCFNTTLSQFDRISSGYGYYQINFSKFNKPCTAELTLIASVGKDGASASSNMSNWYWWQNTSFCSAGSPLCQLQKNGTAWEEWLIRVSWDPVEGLKADGNGYTKNTQLK